MESIKPCITKIRQALSEDLLNSFARKSRFCLKIRKFTPLRAALTVLSGLGSGTVTSVADLGRTFTDITQETIGYKPLHDRLASHGFPEFMRLMLKHFMSTLIAPSLELPKRFSQFEDILAHDATAYTLNDRLKDTFPGIHTQQAPASAALHCTYSLLRGQCQSVEIAAYKEAEIHFRPDPSELKGKLILLDAGFNKASYFVEIDKAGGHFICRAGAGMSKPKLKQCHLGIQEKVKGKRLAEIELPKHNVDFETSLNGKGVKEQSMRLVCIYVQNEKKFTRKRGKGKQKKYTHINLYTNLPKSYSVKDIGDLYRLRWQVELFFKECKSHTCLQKLQTGNAQIVEGLIWGSMLAILFRRYVLSQAFHKTGMRGAEFIAAKMSWMFLRDLMKNYRKRSFRKVLTEWFETLKALAARTNPQRKTGWDEANICPA